MKAQLRSIMLVSIVLFLVACGGIAIKRLVPDIVPVSDPVFNKSLRVLNVTGARKEIFGGPELVSNEEYREALVVSLKRSNLFAEVITEGNADYDLRTTIIAHGQGDSLNYKSAMVVEYAIVDANTKKEMWKKGFNSRHKVTVAQSFSGAARTTKAQEGSVRKNLSQFIASLAVAELN